MSFGDVEAGYGAIGPDGHPSQPRRPQAGPRGVFGGDDEAYMKLNESTTSAIYEISKRVNDIQKLVDLLGSRKDTVDLRSHLKQATHETTDLARSTEHSIVKMGSMEGRSQGESQMRRKQQEKLAKDFGFVLKRFQEVSRVSMEKQRRTVAVEKERMESEVHPPTLTPGADGWDESERESLVAAAKKQQLDLMENEIKFHEDIIAEREAGIRDAQATILEVNEIFQDLGTLVASQGQMIDNIENNIEEVAARTGDAHGELGKASKYQKSARTKMCWLLFCLLIIVAAIVVVTVLTSKK